MTARSRQGGGGRSRSDGVGAGVRSSRRGGAGGRNREERSGGGGREGRERGSEGDALLLSGLQGAPRQRTAIVGFRAGPGRVASSSARARRAGQAAMTHGRRRPGPRRSASAPSTGGTGNRPAGAAKRASKGRGTGLRGPGVGRRAVGFSSFSKNHNVSV